MLSIYLYNMLKTMYNNDNHDNNDDNYTNHNDDDDDNDDALRFGSA